MALDALTRTAVTATLHCLTGCAIGEVLGRPWRGLGDRAYTPWPRLAFVFGMSVPVLRSGMSVRRAVGVALAADTVSIVTMEVIDNGVMLAVPGAMDAGLSDPLFWGALAFALTVAFVLTVPVTAGIARRRPRPTTDTARRPAAHDDHADHSAHV